jgi:hypothetical protein
MVRVFSVPKSPPRPLFSARPVALAPSQSGKSIRGKTMTAKPGFAICTTKHRNSDVHFGTGICTICNDAKVCMVNISENGFIFRDLRTFKYGKRIAGYCMFCHYKTICKIKTVCYSELVIDANDTFRNAHISWQGIKMNNRYKTDFLCASSTFLMGVGSVLNLHGANYAYNTCGEPDTVAIANDWRMVGQDIADNLKKAKSEIQPAVK